VRVPAAFYPSGADVGGEWILEEKNTSWNKAQTSIPRFGPREVWHQYLRGDDSLRYRGTLDYFLCLRRASWRKSGTWDGIRDDCMRAQAPPDFPRCDREGPEVEVFRRAQRLLKEKRPGLICEMHSERNQRNRRETFLRFAHTSEPGGTSHLLALPQ
jgi:hypothetical protein